MEFLFGRKIENDGHHIQVYESANNDGESIVFLHPQGSTSKIWNTMFHYFENDFHVLLMDLRGQGESVKAVSGYDIQTQCKDILAVLEQSQVEKAHLVGNSLGGDIATAFASIYPDKVLSLTNIDSGMINYIGSEGERNLTKEQVIEEFKNREITSFDSISEMTEYLQNKFPPAIWDSYFEEWFKYVSIYTLENGKISYQIPVHINTQIMAMVCDLQYTELYQNIKCPILFLPAEKEEHLQIKLKNIEEAKKHTFTKTSIIPNSKHLMVLDQSKEICLELTKFLNEIKEITYVKS